MPFWSDPWRALTGRRAGDTSQERIAVLLMDMAVLAGALNKPLSTRLLLVPGAVAGDRTHFESPYLVNSIVMRLD